MHDDPYPHKRKEEDLNQVQLSVRKRSCTNQRPLRRIGACNTEILEQKESRFTHVQNYRAPKSAALVDREFF